LERDFGLARFQVVATPIGCFHLLEIYVLQLNRQRNAGISLAANLISKAWMNHCNSAAERVLSHE